jgi:hypothetical protein
MDGHAFAHLLLHSEVTLACPCGAPVWRATDCCRATRDNESEFAQVCKRQEYNLNQHRRQLDVREAHLRICERRCDHREAEIHAARMRSMDMGTENGSE